MKFRPAAVVEFLGTDKGRRVLIICGVALMAALLFGSLKPRESSVSPSPAAEDCAQTERDIEQRLTELISRIDGAGSCTVMVTLDTSSQRVYAEERSSSSSTGDSVRASSEDTSVVLAGSGKEALETGTVLPQVRGVAVVCAGAANPAVREKIANAVCGALGIRLSRVCVTY